MNRLQRIDLRLGNRILRKLKKAGWEVQSFAERAVFEKLLRELRPFGFEEAFALISLHKAFLDQRNAPWGYNGKQAKLVQTLISRNLINPAAKGFVIGDSGIEYFPSTENPLTKTGLRFISRWLGDDYQKHLLYYGVDLQPEPIRNRAGGPKGKRVVEMANLWTSTKITAKN